MTEAQCIAFLGALRCKQIRVKGNGWVEATCPLARWLHKNQTDHTPSFGLSIAAGERSWYLCFACRQGGVEELLSTVEMYSQMSKDYDFTLCHQILADEQEVVPLPEYGEFKQAQQVFSEWPTWWKESFQKANWVDAAQKYLTHRGVSATTIEVFDLRFDTKRNMIVAPYSDVFGRLAGARGRAIGDGPHKHHDYTFQGINNARLVWYNETALNLPGPVVVVEGQFDCWKVAQAHPKTLAALTAKPTLEKMKKLGDCGLVIQIPDRDEAGEQSIETYAKHCASFGLTHKVIKLDEGVKDPAECHISYLKDKITEVANG